MLGLEIQLRVPKTPPYNYKVLYKILDANKRELTELCKIKIISAFSAKEAIKEIVKHIAKQKQKEDWGYIEIHSITMQVDYSENTKLSMQELQWIVEGLRHISDYPGVQELRRKLETMLNLLYDMEMEIAANKAKPIPIPTKKISSTKPNLIKDIKQKLKKEWETTGDAKTLNLLLSLSKWEEEQ